MTPPKAPPAPPNASEIHLRVPTPAEQLARLPQPGTPPSAPLTSGPTASHNLPPAPAKPGHSKLIDIASKIERIATLVPTPNVTDSQLHGQQLNALAAEIRVIANG